jgi:hypothetical protein
MEELGRLGACTFNELVVALPNYTWNQIFMAVDQLSRDGHLVLNRQGQFDYVISTAPKNLPACNSSLTRVSNT